MGQLVPEGRPPVEVAALTRLRRVECYYGTKAHPESAETGETHGSHREVGVRGVRLDAYRVLRRIAVSRRQRVYCLDGECCHRTGEDARLLLVEEEPEPAARGFNRGVVGKCVEQIERVLDPDVVGVAPEGPLQVLARVLDFAEPKLILTKSRERRP